jgi:3-hydroxyacyl-[acyl-carrier protein] dehydratase / trans-2-decenoyl-[acyl-carrier protein] isomerase
VIQKPSYDKRDLLRIAMGPLDGKTKERLPSPPFLMFDRISEISAQGGAHGRGLVVAEKDVVYDEWFFLCHFRDDPVMPGCLGLDALWQLCGFFLAWAGYPGQGRALGCGAVTFEGEVRPTNKLIRYDISVRRVIGAPSPVLIGDGKMSVDGKEIYQCKDLKVGKFDLPYEWP